MKRFKSEQCGPLGDWSGGPVRGQSYLCGRDRADCVICTSVFARINLSFRPWVRTFFWERGGTAVAPHFFKGGSEVKTCF